MALTVGGGAAKLIGEKHERRSSLALRAGAREGALALSGRQLWSQLISIKNVSKEHCL